MLTHTNECAIINLAFRKGGETEMIKFRDVTPDQKVVPESIKKILPLLYNKPLPGSHPREPKKKVSISKTIGLTLNKGMKEHIEENGWKAAIPYWDSSRNQLGLWFWQEQKNPFPELSLRAYKITFYPKSARISARGFVEANGLLAIVSNLGKVSFNLYESEENPAIFIAILE